MKGNYKQGEKTAFRMGENIADQAPPSMGFSRQEYWSGVPLPSWIRKETNKIMLDSDRCITEKQDKMK